MARDDSVDQEPVFVAHSRVMREMLQLVDTVAASDCCVLIEGDSGTGKELIARRLHNRSARAAKPFIPVNCAGISETLFESQFFGHVKGAFTGAEQMMLGLVRTAEGGTLLLDEVGEIPQSLQPKLLRVLQDGEVLPVGTATPMSVELRFIAATNRNLSQDVKEGRFRQDLFYRLNVVRIHLPPLRDHLEDVDPLLDHFLTEHARHSALRPIALDAAVRRRLGAHTWPGNVRELASWVERLYATGLPPEVLAESLFRDAGAMPAAPTTAVMSLAQAERWAISQALRAAQNNRQRTANLLQIHRTTLTRKLQEYSLA